MMRPHALIILTIYSVALVNLEWHTSQEVVRHFFSDIEGDTPFYAINTTLCVALLWSTALMFGVCLACTDHRRELRSYRFFQTQVFVFTYLGFDDRLKIHEGIGGMIGVGDHYVLLAIGLLEIAFLGLLGGRLIRASRASVKLIVAAALFVIMLFIDACVPPDLKLRLSIEDLAKTWANVFFFWFAWDLLMDRLRELKSPGGFCVSQ